MTAHRDLKKRIRARMARTGERYAAASEHVLREREQAQDGVAVDEVVQAAVLKVNERSARVRVLGQTDELTVRAPELACVAPAQIATLRLTKHWTWRGDAYASGQLIEGRFGPEDDDDEPGSAVEHFAFGLIYALGVLSFADARPRGVSDIDFQEKDDWNVGDMVRHLRFERGELRFYADYVRGRCLKTTIVVRADGTFLLETVNRCSLILRTRPRRCSASFGCLLAA